MRNLLVVICSLFCIGAAAQGVPSDVATIRFTAGANGENLVLRDSNYVTAHGEPYRVTRLKYYVSRLRFISTREQELAEEVYLIDATQSNVVTLPRPKAVISGIEFQLGVDSLLNCSGAQSGALDPLNDMFWTWNNGYIMFKLDGNSDSSKSDLNRLEFHIGGFKGTNNVARNVRLMFQKPLPDDAMITINLDLDKLWAGKTNIHFRETPVISFPGRLAVGMADNFPAMFSVIQ